MHLEMLFHYERAPTDKRSGTFMRCDPRFIADLQWMGFQMMSTAHNHPIDFGEGGILKNIKNLNKYGVVHAGSEPNRRFPYPEDGAAMEAEILNTIEGVNFGECYRRSIPMELGGIAVRCVGIQDLIMLKQIAARSGNDRVAHARNLGDIDALSRLTHDTATHE